MLLIGVKIIVRDSAFYRPHIKDDKVCFLIK